MLAVSSRRVVTWYKPVCMTLSVYEKGKPPVKLTIPVQISGRFPQNFFSPEDGCASGNVSAPDFIAALCGSL